MFDPSSDSSATESPIRNYSLRRTPPPTPPSSPKQNQIPQKTKPSKLFVFLIVFLSSLPMIFYIQRNPPLNCTDGLTRFCHACPENSKCSISTFSCQHGTTQFNDQCIKGKHNLTELKNVYTLVENLLKNKETIPKDIKNKFTYEDLSLIMTSKGEYIIDDNEDIRNVSNPSFITYALLSVTITFFVLTINESFVFFK